MDFFAWTWISIPGRLRTVFNADSPNGPVALGGALVFTVLFYADARRQRGRKVSLAGFFRSIFPSRIIWRPSSRLDLRLWVFGTLCIPEKYEKITFGVGAKHVQFDTVLKAFALPFSCSADHLVQWAGGLRARLRRGGGAVSQPSPNTRASKG